MKLIWDGVKNAQITKNNKLNLSVLVCAIWANFSKKYFVIKFFSVKFSEIL